VQEGSFERRLFDFLSGAALRWNQMPDDFERFIYPGIDFAVPSDPVRYERRLIERFPEEAEAIRRYFRDIRAVSRWYILGIQEQMMPAPLAFLLALYRRLGRSKATQTTGEYLEHNFRSPGLRALLASQWADYGLPPRESAFTLHALVIGSYFRGGWFPEGGAGRIARTFERASRQAQGRSG
jgi:phytoene dehydrogenase-like protein